MISFLARHSVVDVHYHQCFQVVVSLRNAFDSIIDGIAHQGLAGFIVNQHITHSCQAQDTEALVYFIDSESHQGWQLKNLLDGKPFIPIDTIPLVTDTNMARFAESLLNQLLPGFFSQRPIDDRIRETLTYIDCRLDDRLELDEVAGRVFLSAERFRHLFAQETGIPFSQYVLWKRIKQVIFQVLQHGLSMSTASIQNGFTDQAHFTRIFRRTFGVSAKQLLKNSRYVQFLTPYVEVALPS
ncbi:AraC family transcriptional regulator [Flavitalea sp. BT771]|uniref:helix-turn-helix transcriptional regulator n=1 Tax=Flavitalea sp. BT771 TaxID=3063329 RepID=UPI0026E23EE3|nr:AraC family transcriptional regulator [Flavitalea sp. BT771]MDO6430252.1 AraC family transcriptional regulator [Flavitalea sp. BT771]MDV6219608.1 AraC family transcriptional regulator [Flavitalea sp. BT771]